MRDAGVNVPEEALKVDEQEPLLAGEEVLLKRVELEVRDVARRPAELAGVGALAVGEELCRRRSKGRVSKTSCKRASRETRDALLAQAWAVWSTTWALRSFHRAVSSVDDISSPWLIARATCV